MTGGPAALAGRLRPEPENRRDSWSRPPLPCQSGMLAWRQEQEYAPKLVPRALERSLSSMKILIVDDHALIREALRGVLREIGEDSTILEAANGHQAMRLVERHPDLTFILLDLALPDRDGFVVLTELRATWPAISVVILSASNDRDSVMKALDLGALGFIPKSGQREVMLNALRLIFSGGIYIPPEILARPTAAPEPAAVAPPREPIPAGKTPTELGLTQRQLQVLALMMRGKSNKAICRTLDLAEPTVKNHVTAILKSLNASNRTEAVVAAGALGWELPQVEG